MWGTAACKWNPTFIKEDLPSHLEISVQIHGKAEELRDLSSLIYVKSVLKSSIECRNCCLMVRFLQIAPLQSQCLIPHLTVGEDLCHHLSFMPIPASFGRWEVCGLPESCSPLEPCCFQQKGPKEPFRKNCLVYSNLKIYHYSSFLIILFKSWIWSRSGLRQGSFCDYCSVLKIACGTLVDVKI